VTPTRQWTIYLAQDKHLDYNWCGSTTEIELRMAALLDYYLEQAEERGSRWNLDSTLWLEVYRRHRGEAGARRLLAAIRKRQIGYAANRSVLLWGILSTELAIRACTGSVPIQRATRTANRTALIMENAGLQWGAGNILSACRLPFLARGIYDLRADTYIHDRPNHPLFWWKAPDGQRILVHWPPYADTQSWGGYAEAFALARIAGEQWDAFAMQDFGDRNKPAVFAKRKQFIRDTVSRYEACGVAYPISSILLLGTGWDNWTRTDDYALFIEKFNAETDGQIRLVDARYEDFFAAAEKEIRQKKLDIPILEGSFGICWEEWAAHLGGQTRDFRQADRTLRLAEATQALRCANGEENVRALDELHEAHRALLDFAEHDMGGCDRIRASLSAGVRAGAAARGLDLARSLAPAIDIPAVHLKNPQPETLQFTWRRQRVTFNEKRCAVASLIDPKRGELIPQKSGLSLGEFIHTLYRTDQKPISVFPEAIDIPARSKIDECSCRRGTNGVEIRTRGNRYGFDLSTHWFFHATHPWIDITYSLEDGWSDAPQSIQFCFPVTLQNPAYRYDTAGAVLTAGSQSQGGDDLPGANPSLFAAQNFAVAAAADLSAILLTPDAPLVQFGPDAVQSPRIRSARIPAQIVSMPLMNLTRNDHQFGQGGQRQWTFRYRLILAPGRWQPLRPFREAQRFGTPPFLQVPGQKPTVPGLEKLDIDFAGGPVTAFKVAEDGKRLILRLWNILDHPVSGSARIPIGHTRAETCDGLERRLSELPVERNRVGFTAGARSLLTLAFRN
jgi:hypothetical protein